MAKAKAYDTYEDVGMAFTVEEVADWSVTDFANERVETLLRAALGWERYGAIPDMPKAALGAEFSKALVNVATWYCHAMVIEGVDRAGLVQPETSSKEGKALTKWAQDVDPAEWVAAYRAEVLDHLRYVVTIGRRSGWSKAQHKESNRLCNCLVKELSLADKFTERMGSLSS